MEYDLIAQEFRWGLSEIRSLSVPERRFWAELVMYRSKKRQQEAEERG